MQCEVFFSLWQRHGHLCEMGADLYSMCVYGLPQLDASVFGGSLRAMLHHCFIYNTASSATAELSVQDIDEKMFHYQCRVWRLVCQSDKRRYSQFSVSKDSEKLSIVQSVKHPETHDLFLQHVQHIWPSFRYRYAYL